MIQRLKNFLKEPTSRDIIVNTIGNYLNIFFAVLFVLILARLMTRAEYGVMSVLLGIAYVLANVLEFGTTATIYSSIPDMYASSNPLMYRFIKSTFFFQSIFSVSIIIILFFTFPWLDAVFFKTHAPQSVLNMTAISVLLFIWQNFITNILFAAKKFLRANIDLNIANVAKTLVILALAYWGHISVGIVIFVFGILGPVIFFLLQLYKHKKILPDLYKAKIHKEDVRFSYTMTYFVASQFYNLGLRMDLFLLSYFGLKEELGDYGIAQKIILTIIASIVSITQVLSPKFASIHNKTEARKQFKVGFYYLLLPTAIFIALYFTPKFVFELIFTAKFKETAAITQALALPFILNAIGSIPTLFLLYSVKKPWHILYSNIIFFLIISIGAYISIPVKGVFGPPLAILVAFVAATSMQTVAMVKEYRKLEE